MKKLSIDDVFYTRRKGGINHDEFKKCKTRVIGLYYKGVNGNSDWKTEDDMMNDLRLMIQFSEEPFYDHCSWSNYDLNYKKLEKEVEEDSKLLPEYRKYEFNNMNDEK